MIKPSNLGPGVASLSADNEYQIQRLEDIQQNKPKHVFEGIGRGLLSFGRGIFDGISGLVTQPIKGSQQEGTAGFFKGVGRGFAGVVVKPVVGALDLASKTTEGIKNTTELFQPAVNRKRLPRHFKTGKLEVGRVARSSEGFSLTFSDLHFVTKKLNHHLIILL